jgi:hypothetical protein
VGYNKLSMVAEHANKLAARLNQQHVAADLLDLTAAANYSSDEAPIDCTSG